MLIILSSTIDCLSVTLMGSTLKRGEIDQQIDNKAKPEISVSVFFIFILLSSLNCFFFWRIK